MTLTCTKTYFDVPFAHRQHLHDGHCSFIHGHNWDIRVTFGCERTDENGFVVDFGKLKFLKAWIEEKSRSGGYDIQSRKEATRRLSRLLGYSEGHIAELIK